MIGDIIGSVYEHAPINSKVFRSSTAIRASPMTACSRWGITGGIAEAWYGEVPVDVQKEVRSLLPNDLLDILQRFESRYLA